MAVVILEAAVEVTAAVQAMTITGEDTEGAVILEVTQEAIAREVPEVMILVRVVVEAALEACLYIQDHDQDQSQKVHTLPVVNLTPVRYHVHAHVPFPGLDRGHILTRNRFLEAGAVV